MCRWLGGYLNLFTKSDSKQQKCFSVYELLSKSESVKFSLIESVICLFTDSSVKTIFFTVKSVTVHWSNQWNLTDSQKPRFSYLNQSNFTDNQ